MQVLPQCSSAEIHFLLLHNRNNEFPQDLKIKAKLQAEWMRLVIFFQDPTILPWEEVRAHSPPFPPRENHRPWLLLITDACCIHGCSADEKAIKNHILKDIVPKRQEWSQIEMG